MDKNFQGWVAVVFSVRAVPIFRLRLRLRVRVRVRRSSVWNMGY